MKNNEMKNNETSFRHSRAAKIVCQPSRKKSLAGPEFRNNTERSAGTQRRKLEAEERRCLRKERAGPISRAVSRSR